jgi:hypothetical protein
MSVIRTLTRDRRVPPRDGHMRIPIQVNRMSSLCLPRLMEGVCRWPIRASRWMTEGGPSFHPSLLPWLHPSIQREQTTIMRINIMSDDRKLSTVQLVQIRRDSRKALRPPPNCQAVRSLPRERLRPVANRNGRRLVRRITEEARISRSL